MAKIPIVRGKCVALSQGHPFRSTSTCSATLKLSEPHTFRTFVEVSLTQAWLIINSLFSPFPSPENGEWDRKFQAPSHGLFFLVTSPHSGGCPGVTRFASLERKTLLSLRKLQGFRSPVSGTGDRDGYIFSRISHLVTSFCLADHLTARSVSF